MMINNRCFSVVVNYRGFARGVNASMLPIVLPLSYHSVLFSLTDCIKDVRRIIRKKCNNISYAKQVNEKKS